MTVTKLYNSNESIKDCPHKYIKTLTADTNPGGVEPGSELWDAQADLTYVTNDGSTWYQKKSVKYSAFSYSPGLKDTGDLEAATKTITAVAEASGVGNADYSSAQTLAIPADIRLAIARIAARLSVTIDSDDGTHDLRCRVYVDAQAANNLLFDLTYSSTGNQLAVQDTLVGTKDTIFNLLKDGAAHTFYFFFWTPGNHAAVISVVNLWYGVGCSVNGAGAKVMSITLSGMLAVHVRTVLAGGGTGSVRMGMLADTGGFLTYVGESSNTWQGSCLLVLNPELELNPSTGTTINVVNMSHWVLRSD
jgi:hypothetical protein